MTKPSATGQIERLRTLKKAKIPDCRYLETCRGIFALMREYVDKKSRFDPGSRCQRCGNYKGAKK